MFHKNTINFGKGNIGRRRKNIVTKKVSGEKKSMQGQQQGVYGDNIHQKKKELDLLWQEQEKRGKMKTVN